MGEPVKNSSRTIQAGDLVLLWFEKKEVTYLVEVLPGKQVGIHCGKPLATEAWIGLEFGKKIECEYDTGYLLKPTLDDLMMKASRESGVVYPKDAGYLILKGGIRTGGKILEVGTGSGALTLALAQTVAPEGCVHTFDCRTDLPKNAVKNITRAGLEKNVVFHQRVPGEPFPEEGFHAAILDIPTPWEEIENVKKVLCGGAKVISLNPTVNQIERMAEALREHGFIGVECVELLERPILARAGKTRPVQRMVSHTEYLLFGTKTV
ncbi:MAG: tRNA (adenine-N1)-methyltransferase [Candidatus Omnitrophota bacterium]